MSLNSNTPLNKSNNLPQEREPPKGPFAPRRSNGNSSSSNDNNNNHDDRIRIAIVGGGIAGITAAQAIAKQCSRLNNNSNNNRHGNSPPPEIVVFEADPAADTPFDNSSPTANDGKPQPVSPRWTAATARNANSIVPGASMHIMSQRSTLWQIARDTVSETMALKYEQIMKWLGYPVKQLGIDNFDVTPPYFAFHVFKCIGPNVSGPERK